MKTGKKAMLMTLCAVLLIVASVMGTVAYLTSSDTVTNTFTVGNVKITLDEAKVDEYGVAASPAVRVDANTYKLLPGHEYTKDPTVTVIKGSEESYIRMLVTVSDIDALKEAFPVAKYADFYNGDIFLLQKLVTGWDSAVWVSTNVVNEKTDGSCVYEFRYKDTVDASKATADKVLEPLFKTIVIPDSVDGTALAELDQVKITVTAEAIQADGFTTAADAYAALDAKTVA
jgi:predicted ribosomally synthesized peptide with SipW-like signal peptide